MPCFSSNTQILQVVIIVTERNGVSITGSAMLGAVASGKYENLMEAMGAMSHLGHSIQPENTTAEYHARKYNVFHQLYEDQMRYDSIKKGIIQIIYFI